MTPPRFQVAFMYSSFIGYNEGGYVDTPLTS